MLRHRRFLLTMHRLALMGALLMAVAPVISRWVQSQASVGGSVAQVVQAMCHGQALPSAGKTVMPHVGHAMDMAMPMTMDHDDGMPMPAGHDEAACDYCVLAANLLPFVLVLLLLPLLQSVIGRLPGVLASPRASALWPAHAARGPPLYA
ncbi:DUF2946 family protein [Pseudoxanthomonas sp.]|uniref:DUF2946 family protein n=1 Tax=Pseudoxanthomonas sp. TaxID=1871049 RepID=UPI002638C94E|nr:DUF2946 family protein [Pseudoxanthomonas sp.]WDS35785.1 MAG: DUF2946 family protein [Pseudoxanthomonas sp.]